MLILATVTYAKITYLKCQLSKNKVCNNYTSKLNMEHVAKHIWDCIVFFARPDDVMIWKKQTSHFG